jgi:hypothetical protein
VCRELGVNEETAFDVWRHKIWVVWRKALLIRDVSWYVTSWVVSCDEKRALAMCDVVTCKLMKKERLMSGAISCELTKKLLHFWHECASSGKRALVRCYDMSCKMMEKWRYLCRGESREKDDVA